MPITQSFFKKCLFLLTFFLIFTASNCDEVDIGTGAPTHPIPGQIPGSPQECQFYRIQSLIMSCYKNRGFFKEINPDHKKIITHVCVKYAFEAGQGVTLKDPYIPESGNKSGLQWYFSFGNMHYGNRPHAPPSHIEQQHFRLLNAFKNSIDVNRFSSCLGMEKPYLNVHALITSSGYAITQGQFSSETFVNCYQAELDAYKAARQACVAAPVTPHHSTTPHSHHPIIPHVQGTM